MEKKMTDLEIIKQEVDFLDKYMADHELDERFEAILTSATRMAAEIEGLKADTIEANKKAKNQGRTACNLFDELKKLQKENRELEAAHAEKPDIVRCGECINYHGGIYTSAEDVESSQPPCCYYFGIHINDNDFCSRGTRKEAKDED